MKAYVFQPAYSMDFSQSDALFAWELDALDRCDESMDVIVLPEYSDVPCATSSLEETLFYHNKYIGILLDMRCCRHAVRSTRVRQCPLP